MIDAYLYAARDAIRGAGLGYSPSTCDIQEQGMPPATPGDVYVAIHQLRSRSTADNCLDERYGFALTLSMRVVIPLDRVGDRLLAMKLANSTGFNRRADALRALCHMDWGILQDANQYLCAWGPSGGVVYGFTEPARYRGMDDPVLVGSSWFGEEEGGESTGLKSELRFEDARRIQAIATYE